MRNLSDTMARLAAFRGDLPGMTAQGDGGDLVPLRNFGTDPGALAGYSYVPEGLPDHAPLVVVLHGCTQTAAGYDRGSGWSHMAERHGFALLFPEQQRQNNANLCFNWFVREDIRRDSGEAMSIRQMIAAMVAAHGIDPARVFVTGLSAGGAMASVMLATYPEVFAGGAIVAGLPYGVAGSVPQAFDRMRGHGMPDDAALVALVRDASGHAGPWPTLSIWHGSADATVAPSNADAIVGQWRALHGAGERPDAVEVVDGQSRRVWRDRSGRDAIEAFSVAGMGHGTPLRTTGDDACGTAGAYMLEAGISSTWHICRFWGLLSEADARVQRPRSVEASRPTPRAATVDPAGATVAKVIEDALRAAGLMRR